MMSIEKLYEEESNSVEVGGQLRQSEYQGTNDKKTCRISHPQLSPSRRPITRSQTGRVVAISQRPIEDSGLGSQEQTNFRIRVTGGGGGGTRMKDEPKTQQHDSSSTSSRSSAASSLMRRDGYPPTAASARNVTVTKKTSSAGWRGGGGTVVRHRQRHHSISNVSGPVPIPNLTKKSRGRRVPTKLAPSNNNNNNISSGDSLLSLSPSQSSSRRLFVCQVENCGKCFYRGEHLKRHIRSIHTYEKPFKCPLSQCEKHFNRHDNLLQHLRVHKPIRKPEQAYESSEDTLRMRSPTTKTTTSTTTRSDLHSQSIPLPMPQTMTPTSIDCDSRPDDDTVKDKGSSPPEFSPLSYYPSPNTTTPPSPSSPSSSSLPFPSPCKQVENDKVVVAGYHPYRPFRSQRRHPPPPRYYPSTITGTSSSAVFSRGWSSFQNAHYPSPTNPNNDENILPESGITFAASNVAVSSIRTEIRPTLPPPDLRILGE